ncbi:FlgD immunoglobulin-like domain containing protein [Kineosporia succinea]|uniref:FlgD/Vpr Ig-like domain-containing protein n=1 Tax=Kineosporia succinea TaxID=84632 RepID=A0ABT9NVX5_9ACTN|nr:FlgD immunoglobulin-like domain containing protein [Kineosporia succinea]MDP9824576.1 hypothetical protein [Kineosporia succinea]
MAVITSLASPARADDVSLTVPLHTRATDVTLIGASTTGAAVLQTAPSAQDPDVVQTGAWGATLKPRPEVVTTPGFREYFQQGAVSDGTLGWGMAFVGSISSSTHLHRTDLITGATTTDGRISGRSFTLTGSSWVSSPDPWSVLPFGSQKLLEYPLSSLPNGEWASLPTTLWKPGVPSGTTPVDTLTAWAADTTSAVVATRSIDGGSSFQPDGPLQILGVPLGGGTPQLLATGPAAGLTGLAIGASTVAWATDSGTTRSVSAVARTGGTPLTRVETDADADLAHLSVTDDGTVGYLVPGGSTGVTLRTVNGSTTADLALPAGSAGLDAVGRDFVTATGRGTAPGVYRISPGGSPVLAAPLTPAGYPLGAWDLAAGRVYYTDRSRGSARSLPIFSRAVGAELGAETELSAPAGSLPGPSGRPTDQIELPVAFSGARGLVGSPRYNLQWDVLDRGERIAVLEQTPVKNRGYREFPEADPQISGPYVSLGGQIQRTDGQPLFTLPAAARTAAQVSLFGSQALYGTTASRRGQVWLVNAEKPRPVKLFEQTCAHAPAVALWGRTAVWLNCTGTRAAVRDLVTGTTRSVATGTTDPDPGLTLGEGALAWLTGGTVTVLDLSGPASAPVPLAGTGITSLALDTGRIATTDASGLTVAPLPFEVASHPRLTGLTRLLGFSPDGDGVRDVWAPTFDTTEALDSATLRITSEKTGRTVYSQTTRDVADGGIRDLRWDGFLASGLGAPRGYYTWSLTAESPTGAALTTAADGKKIAGRIELSR